MALTETRHPELEELAAYLDGALPADERAAVTAHLADCSHCYALFLAAAEALNAEEEAGEGGTSPRPFPAGGGWGRWVLVAAAAVALLVGAAWAVRLLSAGPPGSPSLVASLETPAPELVGHLWQEATVRGDPVDLLARDAQGFLLGVRQVDLRVALTAGDAAVAADVARRIVNGIAGVEWIDEPVAFYERVRDGAGPELPPAELLGAAAEVEEEIDRLGRFGEVLVPLGRWVEAARLAAATGDAAYLARRRTRRGLDRLLRHLDEEGDPLPPAIRDRLEGVRESIDGGALDEAALAAVEADLRWVIDFYEKEAEPFRG